MVRYLIKNNFKLMFRNKWILSVLIAGPIMVIAILSSAFQDLMKSYEGVGEFRVGYRIEAGSVWCDYIDVIKEAGEEAGITFFEYPEGEPKELMERNDLAGFVELANDNYTVYESNDYQVEGITLEYFLNRVMKENTNQVLQRMIPAWEKESVNLPIQELEYLPAVDSKDYYGIIYLVYFSWCGIVCAANVLSSEKKYGIERKFQVAPVSDMKLYFGKWISVVLVVAAGMGIAALATIFLFQIHWGKPLLSACLMLLSIMASIAYGLMLYYICKDLAITIIVLFTTVWFMGFFGGSFETYMFSIWSDSIKNMTPIYHINRALVEISCMGHSEYTASCIVYMLIIIAVCSAVSMAVEGIRKRGRA